MRASLSRTLLAAALAGVVWNASSTAALAHVGRHASEFAGGLLHPLTGLDHLFAAVAVGLWASQLDRSARWLLPILFPATMIVGVLLSMGGNALLTVEPAIAGSVLLLGALIASARRPAIMISAPLVALLALVHGYSHGLESPAQDSTLAYHFGLSVTTLALVAIGLGGGMFAARRPLRAAARSAGVAIAAIGAVLLLA
jgi:urease accessory protein